MSVDPLADITVSPYAYVWNDPVNFADPTGLMGERKGGNDPCDPPSKRSFARRAIDWIFGRKSHVSITVGMPTSSREPDQPNGGVLSGFADGITEESFNTVTFKGIRDIASTGANTIRSVINPSARNNNIFSPSTLCVTGDCMNNTLFNNLEPGMDVAFDTFNSFRNGDYYNVGKNAGMSVIILGSMIFAPEGGGSAGKGLSGKNWRFNPIKDVDMRGGATHWEALEEAFKRTGVPKELFKVTKWGKDVNGKSVPVEYVGPGGANVNMDIPAFNNVKAGGKLGEGPHQPHVGYQTQGRGTNRVRGHIFIDNVPATR